ncbi:MAG: tetratricopeptide repeat protein [Bacteroidetes bacterium]|nr:tetratricopeptide repeat protein [Bacteroidota bacterium]
MEQSHTYAVWRNKACLIGLNWLKIAVLLLTAHTASAQFDTLLNRPFNDRFSQLLSLQKDNRDAQTDAALVSQLSALESLASKKGDKKFLAELATVRFKLLKIANDTAQQQLKAEFQKAISTAQSMNYTQLEATLEFFMGNHYWESNDYPPAIQHYEKAYELSNNLTGRDYYLKQEIAYQLGIKYYYLTDYTTSLHYLEKALEDENPLDTVKPKIAIYNTLGLVFLHQDKLDDAKNSFNKALEYARLANSPIWIGNLSGNLGHVYVLQGEMEKGEALLRTDMEISLARGAKGSASGAMLELANLNFNRGRVELAEQQMDSAIQIMGARMPYHRKKTLFPLLSKINAFKGRWQAAAMYIDSSLVVMDSMARMDNAVQILRLKQLVELQASRVEIAEREVKIRKKTLQVYVMIAGLLFAVIGGFLIFRQKEKADLAKKRSDELLLNILPKGVADELKSTGVSKAKKFQDTTVLFCDFKNFTQYSEEMEPEELVRILDSYFKAFDQIVADFGLEKIKTVGDAYICIAGLPEPNPQHAEKVVRCALKFQDIMQNNQAGWGLRIGIHSGPVVAGIVGIKKFAYDIWGDTVNTAARMEQSSEAGKVNISQTTYELVKDKFICTYRGKIAAKHKGELDMYFVEGYNEQ